VYEKSGACVYIDKYMLNRAFICADPRIRAYTQKKKYFFPILQCDYIHDPFTFDDKVINLALLLNKWWKHAN